MILIWPFYKKNIVQWAFSTGRLRYMCTVFHFLPIFQVFSLSGRISILFEFRRTISNLTGFLPYGFVPIVSIVSVACFSLLSLEIRRIEGVPRFFRHFFLRHKMKVSSLFQTQRLASWPYSSLVFQN